MKCQRCGGPEATNNVKVQYYAPEQKEIITASNDLCDKCETFYKDYKDKRGKSLSQLPLNVSVVYSKL